MWVLIKWQPSWLSDLDVPEGALFLQSLLTGFPIGWSIGSIEANEGKP